MKVRLSLLVALVACSFSAADAQTQSPPYDMQARIDSAKEIIRGNNEYIERAHKLHAQIEQTIKVAETLKGKATDLEIKINEANLRPHLTGAQLKAAQAQYAGDLNQFKTHANAYAAHLNQFRATLGECHANDQLYQQQVQKIQLHVEQFHMPVPVIRPPHICGRMMLSDQEMRHVANQMAMDNARVQQAEVELNASANKLAGAMAQQSSLAGKALTENKREVEEQKLAQEFSRLKEEYDTLTVEHAALTGKNAGGTLSSQTVHGTIKK